MDLTFTAGDLIQIIVLLATVMTSYWKLSTRISLVEVKTETMERTGRVNETKLEHKIDALTLKIEKLIEEVTTLKAKADH